MISKKSIFLIYIIIFLFVLIFLSPVFSFSIDEDSIYVWSTASSSVSTSAPPTDPSELVLQNDARKFSKYN